MNRSRAAALHRVAVGVVLAVLAFLATSTGPATPASAHAVSLPVAEVRTPTAEQTLAPGPVRFTGIASSGVALRSVSLNVRNVSTGTISSVATVLARPRTTSTTWSASWTPPTAARYSVRARVVDSAGRVALSPLVYFRVAAAGPAYLTILFGRNQLAHTGTACSPLPNTVPLTAVIPDLARRGVRSTGAVVVDRTAETTQTCTEGALYPSWEQLAAMRSESGATFISAGTTYVDNSTLTAEQQRQNICGSLPALAAHGHDRAWGLFAYPDNKGLSAAQLPVTANCFAFGRKYSGVLNTASSTATSPYYLNTRSVTGGACNDPALPCYSIPVVGTSTGATARYFPLPTLASLMAVPSGHYSVVQLYKFVTGSYRTTATSGPRWDCTSPDWRAHYTTIPETYCYGDLLTALDSIRPGTTITDPATVAEAWASDRSSPTTVITTGPAAETPDTTASFGFTSSHARSWYACSLDGGSEHICTPGVTYAQLTAGEHTLSVRSTNHLGRSSEARHAWTVQAAGSAMTLQPSVVDFGDVPVGSSQERVAALTNTGDAPLDVSAVQAAGDQAGDYGVAGTCPTAAPLEPGQTCSVIVTFTPSAPGTRSAVISVTTDRGSESVGQLRGNGQESAPQ